MVWLNLLTQHASEQLLCSLRAGSRDHVEMMTLNKVFSPALKVPESLFSEVCCCCCHFSVQLCDPIDSSPPGSSVPGILQARTLEQVAISLSNAWKWKVKVKSLSHVRLLATPWTAVYQAPLSMGFSRQEYWSGLPLPSPFRRLRT